MDFTAKAYDRIRVSKRRAALRAEADAGDTRLLGHRCAAPGCAAEAEYRAPQGRGREGQYFWFCLDHVREYNKSYNYFEGMTDDDVIAFQRDAITGHRPTQPIGVRGKAARAAKSTWTGAVDDPFTFFGQEPHAAHPEAPKRLVKGPERAAFEVMGLPHETPKEEIKARYKALVKRHHPDANHGDRSSEDRLRSVITAYNVLRRAGYC